MANGLPGSAYLSPEETQEGIDEGAKFVEEWFKHPETIGRLLSGYGVGQRIETGELAGTRRGLAYRNLEALADMLESGSFDMSRHTEINLPQKIERERSSWSFPLLKLLFPSLRKPDLYEEPEDLAASGKAIDAEAYYELRGFSEIPREHRPFGFMKFKTQPSDRGPSWMPTLSTHEYTHRAQDLFGGLHVGEKQFMYDLRKEEPWKPFQPEEDHANLMMIRKELYDRGLIEGPGETITKDMMKTLGIHDLYSKEPTSRGGMRDVLKNLSKRYETKDLITLLNTLASIEEFETPKDIESV